MGITGTILTERSRFILCSSSCSNINNYSISAATLDANDVVVAQSQLGFGWCGADTNADSVVDAYYPAVTVARTASLRYITCPNATLSNCGNAANWTINVQIAATGPVAHSLHLDPTIANDSAKVFANSSAVGKIYSAGASFAAPIGCHSAAGSYAASFAVSASSLGAAATLGNARAELIKGNNKFHLIVNDTNTGVSYFNNTSSSIADLNNTWSTAHAINTTVATGITGDGGAYINSSGKLYSTHHVSLAAGKFNFLLNTISSTSGTSALATSSNVTVNNDGAMEFPSAIASVNRVSVDKTSGGSVGGVYVDYSAGSVATGILKYTYRSGRNVDSSWVVSPILLASAPSFPVLKYDIPITLEFSGS